MVASEVRGLAQRASESAKEIKMLISRSSAQVAEGSALVNRAGESLAQILERSGQLSQEVGALSQEASAQNKDIAAITAQIGRVDQSDEPLPAAFGAKTEEIAAAAALLRQKMQAAGHMSAKAAPSRAARPAPKAAIETRAVKRPALAPNPPIAAAPKPKAQNKFFEF